MKKPILATLLSCVLVAPALAQTMPPPHPAPRIPVHRETLAERRAGEPHDVEGQALILDGEKLKVDSLDLRLFGIVPPQLSASFGPQARAALDELIGGDQNITCHIRDRDHDGRLLATCHSANGTDPALELLRRGLAVAARGSITDTDLAQPYVAAEQAAQTGKLGMWSVTVPAPAAVATPEASKPAEAIAAPKFLPPVVSKSAEAQLKTVLPLLPPLKISASAMQEEGGILASSPSLFARYQILIAVSLMLLTTLSIIAALTYRRYVDKRDEMKALAAALRGELQAARAVCLTRINGIVTQDDDVLSAWPRIRATLYQAYVGRLGWLGAELARQIASIYGQANDYASYYNNLSDAVIASATPKKQALQALVSHIDKVLPRLAGIEQTGQRGGVVRPVKTPMLSQASLARAIPKPVTQMITHVEPPVVAKPANAAPEILTPSSTPAQAAVREGKLLALVRSLRERFTEMDQDHFGLDEPFSDYAAMLEEEAERYSYGTELSEAESSVLGKTGMP